MTSRRAALGRLAVAVVAVLVALILAEGLARLFHGPAFDLGSVEDWALEDMASTHRPPPNRFGHREAEIGDEVFADGVTRVLVLGDSFTFGQGVHDGAARFTDRVEARLNEPGSREVDSRFDVYNAGVNASNPSDWVKTLDVLLPVYRPDVVFAVFFLRSGAHLPTSFRFYQERLVELRRPYEESWLFPISALYRTWADFRVRGKFTREYVGRIHDAYLGDFAQTESWRVEQDALRRLAGRCAELGIPFHLVLFPMLFDLRNNPFDPVEAEVERFAREAGIPFFSLTPGFRGRDASALWVSPSDQHPNEEGHAIAAETLLPYFTSALPRRAAAPGEEASTLTATPPR